MRFEIGKWETVSMLGAIALGAAAALTLAVAWREASRAQARHGQEARLVLGSARLLWLLGGIEAAQRDYIRTGARDRAEACRNAQREASEVLEGLRDAEPRWREQARQKIAHVGRVLAAYESGGTAQAEPLAAEGKALLDELRSGVRQRRREWASKAAALEKRAEFFSNLGRNAAIAGGTGAVFLMLLAGWQVHRRASRPGDGALPIRSGEEQYQMLAARLQQIREEESGSLARRVHDELGQTLTALRFDLSSLARRLDGDEEARRQVRDAIAMADRAVQTVRTIALDLRPGVLDQLGLPAALEWLLGEHRKRYGTRVSLSAPETLEAGTDRELALFRIAQEALTNVARHARASTVQVELCASGDRIELAIRDNGAGIPADAGVRARSFGLLSMQERARLAGGDCRIESVPGGGTTVRVRVPRAAQAERAGSNRGRRGKTENAQARASGG